ncbi:hypothetical protein BGW39_009680 [Mortierella sp. 14UC]|nr:hypothetical protein BGW39_009680 [Mortierella sp. 14UC]
MSPSSRLEARTQARAIPLVTVSLARSQLRQSRFAALNNMNQSTAEQDLDQNQGRHQSQNHNGDQPPSYDSVSSSTTSTTTTTTTTHATSESLQESRLASPSNAALTEAVLHLSRTLVSSGPTKPRPRPAPTSSWLFMMIYSWTHTQKAATRLYHILTAPSSLLQHIQDQNDQIHQQQKKQRKSIQQLTEEQDRMEDDPDMRFGAVTEMVPVSMMNTRSVASMADESLPSSQTQDPLELPMLRGDDLNEDSTLPRKPKRRIESYSNPFAPTDSDTEPQEDDEGWLGRGEDCSEDGVTKTNSVRLTSPTFSHTFRGRIPEFATSSLGPAMDPRQFESDSYNNNTSRSAALPVPAFSTSSLFDRSTGVTFDRPSSRASVSSQSSASNYFTPPSSMVSPAPSANSNRTLVSSQNHRQGKAPSLWQQDTTTVPQEDEHLVSAASSIYHDLPSDDDGSPWSEHSSYREHHQPAALQFPTVVRSSTASFTDVSSIVISSSPPTIIPPAISLSSSASIRSFEAAIS